MKIRDLRISLKLAIGFGIVSAILLVVSAIGLWNIKNISYYDGRVKDASIKLQQARGINEDLDKLYLQLWRLVADKDAATKKECLARIDEHRASYRKALGDLKETVKSDEGKRLLEALEAAADKAREFNKKIGNYSGQLPD